MTHNLYSSQSRCPFIENRNDNQGMSDGSINRKFVTSMIKVSTFLFIYFYFHSVFFSSLFKLFTSIIIVYITKKSEIDLLNEKKSYDNWVDCTSGTRIIEPIYMNERNSEHVLHQKNLVDGSVLKWFQSVIQQ
jgi:hypothetical protein